jgi:hypothetical protein
MITIIDSWVSVPTVVNELVVFGDEQGRPGRTAAVAVLKMPPASTQATGAKEITPSMYRPSVQTPSPGSANPDTHGSHSLQNPVSAAPVPAAGNPNVVAGSNSPVSTGCPGLAAAGCLPGITYSPYNADGTCKSAS